MTLMAGYLEGVAVAIRLSPMIACGAIAFSSVSVVTNSLALKRNDPRQGVGVPVLKAAGLALLAVGILWGFWYVQPFNVSRQTLVISRADP